MDLELSDFKFAEARDVIFKPIYSKAKEQDRLREKHFNNNTQLIDALETKEWNKVLESGDLYEANRYLDQVKSQYEERLLFKVDEGVINSSQFKQLYAMGHEFKKVGMGEMSGVVIDIDDSKEMRNAKFDEMATVTATVDVNQPFEELGLSLQQGEEINRIFDEGAKEYSDRAWGTIQQGIQMDKNRGEGISSEMNSRRLYGIAESESELMTDAMRDLIYFRDTEEKDDEVTRPAHALQRIYKKRFAEAGLEFNDAAIDSLAHKYMTNRKSDREIKGVGNIDRGLIDYSGLDPSDKLDALESEESVFNLLKGKGLSADELAMNLMFSKNVRDNVFSESVKQARADGEDVFGENDFEEYKASYKKNNPKASAYEVMQSYAGLIRDNADGKNGFFTKVGQGLEKNVMNPFNRGFGSATKSVYAGLAVANHFYLGDVWETNAGNWSEQGVDLMSNHMKDLGARDQLTNKFLEDVGGYKGFSGLTRTVMNAAGQSAPFLLVGLATGGTGTALSASSAAIARGAGTTVLRNVATRGVQKGYSTLLGSIGRGARNAAASQLRGNGAQRFAGELLAKTAGRRMTTRQVTGLVSAAQEGLSIYGNSFTDHYNSLKKLGKSNDQAFETASRTALPGALIGATLTAAIGGIDGPGLINIKKLHPNLAAHEALAKTSIRDLIAVAGGKSNLIKTMKDTLDDKFVKSITSSLFNAENAIATGLYKGISPQVLKAKATSSMLGFLEEGLEEGLAGGISEHIGNVLIKSEGVQKDTTFGALVGGIVKEALIGGAAGKVLTGPVGASKEFFQSAEGKASAEMVDSTIQALGGATDVNHIGALVNLQVASDKAGLGDVSSMLQQKAQQAILNQGRPTSTNGNNAAPAGTASPEFKSDKQTAEQLLASSANAQRTSTVTTNPTITDDVKRGQHPIFGKGNFPRSQRSASSTSVSKGASKDSIIGRTAGGALYGKGSLKNHTVLSASKNSAVVVARMNTSGESTVSNSGVNTDRAIELKFDKDGNVASAGSPRAFSKAERDRLGKTTVDALFTKDKAEAAAQSSLDQEAQEGMDRSARRQPPVNVATQKQLKIHSRSVALEVNEIFKRSTPLVVDGKVITKNPQTVEEGLSQLAQKKEDIEVDMSIPAQDREVLLDAIQESEENLNLYKENPEVFHSDKTQATLANQATEDTASEAITPDPSIESEQRSNDSNSNSVNNSTDSSSDSNNDSSREEGGSKPSTQSKEDTGSEKNAVVSEEAGQDTSESTQEESGNSNSTVDKDGALESVATDSIQSPIYILNKEYDYDKLSTGKKIEGTNLNVVFKGVVDGERKVVVVKDSDLDGYRQPSLAKVKSAIKSYQNGDKEVLTSFLQEYTEQALGKDKGFNSAITVKVDGSRNSAFNFQKMELTVGYAAVSKMQRDPAYVAEYLMKAINEEVIHAATYQSFTESYGSPEAATQALHELGESIIADRSKFKFTTSAYSTHIRVNGQRVPIKDYPINVAYEFLNAIVQRSNTGFTTADVRAMAPKKITSQIKNTIKRYVQAFKNALKIRRAITNDADLRDKLVAINGTLSAWNELNISDDPFISTAINKEIESWNNARQRVLTVEETNAVRAAMNPDKATPPPVSIKTDDDANSVVRIPEVAAAIGVIQDLDNLWGGQVADNGVIRIQDGVFISNFDPALLPSNSLEAAHLKIRTGVSIPFSYKYEQAVATLNRYKVADAMSHFSKKSVENVSQFIFPSQTNDYYHQNLAVAAMAMANSGLDKGHTNYTKLRDLVGKTKSNKERAMFTSIISMSNEDLGLAKASLDSVNIRQVYQDFQNTEANNSLNRSELLDQSIRRAMIEKNPHNSLFIEDFPVPFSFLHKYRDVVAYMNSSVDPQTYNEISRNLPDDMNPATNGVDQTGTLQDLINPLRVRAPYEGGSFGVVGGLDFSKVIHTEAADEMMSAWDLKDSKARSNRRSALAVVNQNIASTILDSHIRGEGSVMQLSVDSNGVEGIVDMSWQTTADSIGKSFVAKGDVTLVTPQGGLATEAMSYTNFLSLPKLKSIDIEESSVISGGFFKSFSDRIKSAYSGTSDMQLIDHRVEQLDAAIEEMDKNPSGETFNKVYWASKALNDMHIGVSRKLVSGLQKASDFEQGQTVDRVYKSQKTKRVVTVRDGNGHTIASFPVVDGVYTLEEAQAEAAKFDNHLKDVSKFRFENVDADTLDSSGVNEFVDVHYMATVPATKNFPAREVRGFIERLPAGDPKLTQRKYLQAQMKKAVAGAVTTVDNVVDIQDANNDKVVSFAALQELSYLTKGRKETAEVGSNNLYLEQVFGREYINLEKTSLTNLLHEMDLVKESDMEVYNDAMKRIAKTEMDADFRTEFDPVSGEDTAVSQDILENIQGKLHDLNSGVSDSIRNDKAAPFKRALLAYYLFDGDMTEITKFFTTEHDRSIDELLAESIADRIALEIEEKSSFDSAVNQEAGSKQAQVRSLLEGKEILGWAEVHDGSLAFNFGDKQSPTSINSMDAHNMSLFVATLGNMKRVNVIPYHRLADNKDDSRLSDNMGRYDNVPLIVYSAEEFSNTVQRSVESNTFGNVQGVGVKLDYDSMQPTSGPILDSEGNLVAFAIAQDGSSNQDRSMSDIKRYVAHKFAKDILDSEHTNRDAVIKSEALNEYFDNVTFAVKEAYQGTLSDTRLNAARREQYFGHFDGVELAQAYKAQFEKLFLTDSDKDSVAKVVTSGRILEGLLSDPEMLDLVIKINPLELGKVKSDVGKYHVDTARSFVESKLELMSRFNHGNVNYKSDGFSIKPADSIDNLNLQLPANASDQSVAARVASEMFNDGNKTANQKAVDDYFAQFGDIDLTDSEKHDIVDDLFESGLTDKLGDIRTKSALSIDNLSLGIDSVIDALANVLSFPSALQLGLPLRNEIATPSTRPEGKRGVSLESYFVKANDNNYMSLRKDKVNGRTHYRTVESVVDTEKSKYREAIRTAKIPKSMTFQQFLASSDQGKRAAKLFKDRDYLAGYDYLVEDGVNLESYMPTAASLETDRKQLDIVKARLLDPNLSDSERRDLRYVEAEIDAELRSDGSLHRIEAARRYLNDQRIYQRNKRHGVPFSPEQAHRLSNSVVLQQTKEGFGFASEVAQKKRLELSKGFGSTTLGNMEAIPFKVGAKPLGNAEVKIASVFAPHFSANVNVTNELVGEPLGRSIVAGMNIKYNAANKKAQIVIRREIARSSQIYYDLAQEDSVRKDGEKSLGGMKDQIDAKVANMLALMQAEALHPEAKSAAMFAIRAVRTGNLSVFEHYHNQAQSYALYNLFYTNNKKAIDNKVGKSFGATPANARFAPMDAIINELYSGDASSRDFLDRLITMVNFGLIEGTGRNGYAEKANKNKNYFNDLARNLSKKEEYYATAVSYGLNYIINPDTESKSAREQIANKIEFMSQSRAKMIELGASQKGLRTKMKDQVAELDKVISRLNGELQNTSPILNSTVEEDIRNVFDAVKSSMFKGMTKGQAKFVEGSVDKFREIKHDVQAAAAMNGVEIGDISNYTPLVTYKPDGDINSDAKLYTNASHGKHINTRDIEGGEVFALNLAGSESFRGALDGMMYSTNTRAGYSLFSTMFGVKDPETNENLKASVFNSIHAATTNGDSEPTFVQGSDFFSTYITNILNRDRVNSTEDQGYRKVWNSMYGLAMKQALSSLHQPIKQTVPVMASFAARNFLSPSKMITLVQSLARLFTDGARGLLPSSGGSYRDRLVSKIERFAPHIAQRQADGIDFSDSSLRRAIDTSTLKGKALYTPARALDLLNKFGSLLLKVSLEKPDTWLVRGILDSEYKSLTGQSLADIDDNQVDITAFRKAQKSVESTLAQSDRSLKGSMMQRKDNFLYDVVAQSMFAFSNHTISVGSSSRSGYKIMVNGANFSEKMEGFKMMSDVVIQSAVFRLMGASVLVHVAGQLLGEDEEEAVQIEEDLIKFIENDQFLIEQKGWKPMRGDSFHHRFTIPFIVDSMQSVPGVGVAASVSSTSDKMTGLISDGAHAFLGLDKPYDSDRLLLGKSKSVIGTLGPATIPIQNSVDIFKNYLLARDEYKMGSEDAMFLLYQLAGFRESRTFMTEAIRKRNNTPKHSDEKLDLEKIKPFSRPSGFEFFSTPDVDQ